MPASTINIRIDPEIKAQAQELFSSLGMDMSTAVNIFIRQSLEFNGIPFPIQRRYNAETEKAISDAASGIGLSKPFTSVAELKEALYADDSLSE
ncbi:MAG: type II toxin-antitoxin system RelB/DinJ family antitoxin [Ruminococcus sp.]|nr:type II toxin-antitoxin system RelB/DinJ family antitoxin [Ruminococcus sp.]